MLLRGTDPLRGTRRALAARVEAGRMTSALEIARGYLVDHGWSVVPVPHMSKGPILPDWQKLSITADTIEQYFNGG